MSYYNGFGGAARDFTTRHNLPLVSSFDCANYRVNGGGRDTYISFDNGNNFKAYHPDLHPIRGTIGYGDRKFGEPLHKIGPDAKYKGKCVGYFANGTGRDTYVA